jgi:cytochrome c
MHAGRYFTAALPWLLACAAAQAQPAGDVKKGATVFATECAECHSMKEGKDKKGPSLFGITNRKAAQREGVAYSDALRASGMVWTTEHLSAYLTAPQKTVPGGKMKYNGLANATERQDLLAYLASNGVR